jgi:TRAP-type C4-dicarboxylate transport system permease small subunit
MQIVDRLSRLAAALAAWAFFLIGLMLAYEVIARYFFNAPTIWAEELSRFFLVWSVFVGSAWLIHSDEHIRVTVVVDRLPDALRRILRVLSILFVLLVASLVAFNGWPIMARSFASGATSGTLMDLPNWWVQLSVVVGFGLLALQAVVEVIRTLAGAPLPERSEGRAE